MFNYGLFKIGFNCPYVVSVIIVNSVNKSLDLTFDTLILNYVLYLIKYSR